MQIDTSKVKWDETPKVAAAPQIDAGQVKWDDNVQAPLQAQTQPQKPKKEYGTLEKIYDVVTNNPVANYIPNKIKEWSGIDEDKKVDKETLYNIESLAKVDTRLIGDATPKQKEQYLLNVAKVLDKKGYKLAEVEDGEKKEYVALDAKGNQKEITNNFFNSLVDGILADKYEMAGAIAGAAKGYNLTKAIPSPWTKALGILGGGAIGAMVGTAADTAEVTYKTGQEFKIEDFFNELNKSAALDVAGAVAGAAIIKTGSVVAKGAKKTVEPVIDYVKNNNIAGAKKQLLSDLGVDEAQAAKALENAKLEYKEVEGYAKDGIISDVAKKQEELLAVASQDKRMGKNIIHDIVLDDKDVALNVSKQVDARTKNLINSFEDVAIDGTDVKRAVEGYEKQVGANYGKMRDTFKESFENVDYAFDLKALKTDEIMRNVVDDIVNPYDKDVAKNLLTKVEKIVGDEGGITRNFDNLVEMRQVVNDFYSRASKSLSHDSKEAFVQLKKNIDTELYSAIDKNIPQEMQKPLKDMFDGAIKEYRDMYAIKDTKLYSTLMDDGMSAGSRMDALINHTADDEMEFATLLHKLPSQEQAKIENSITKAVLDKNLFGAPNELQAIDYNKAVTTLGKLEDFMVTQSGKDSVKLIKEMAEKYGDDFDLLRAANQAGVDTGAGIATTIVGKIQYKLAKRSFDKITRLLPTDDGRRLAMYHNIADALKKSRTPMDMAKRVAGSENIAKADKADLLDWARDFNRANSVNNEQQAQKLLLEIEAKEAAKAQADAEAKAMLDDFDAIDPAEILAVQKLGGYDALAQTVRNLNDPSRRSVEDVKKFVDAKAKISPDRLQKQIIDIKYPIKDAEAKIAKLLESSGDEVAAIMDETSLKRLRNNLQQGYVTDKSYSDRYNEFLKDNYKKLMQLYDAKTAQKTPQELLQGKEVELKNLLRKAEFEESVDNVAGATAQRDSARALQDEIDELKRQTEPVSNAETRTSKKLSSQAQAVKDTAGMNHHNSEDEAAQAVKDLFRKNKSEEKQFANMSAEDMAEYERVHGSDAAPKQKSNETIYDEDGEVIPFANPHIGAGVVAGSGNALEYDEEGNLVGFDTEKFVTGFLAGTIGSKAGASALKKFNPKLYNYIAGVSKEFPNMATANPKLLAEIYKSAPTTKGQALMFAGEKAIKADIGKLDDAMKLVDNGASEADAWKQTGWFKGDDGKWRFEIDDSSMTALSKKELDELAKADPYEMIEVPLSQIIKHDRLFEAYPQLKDLKVNWEYSKAKGLDNPQNVYHGASYDPKENLIIIGNGLDEKEIKSSLLHEVQHAIQGIEDFARGESPTNFFMDNKEERIATILDRATAKGHIPRDGTLDDYLKHLKAKNYDGYLDDIIEETDLLRRTSLQNYQRLHGEAEARLTQTRATEGYENFPLSDLDVPRSELIKKFDGSEAQMSQVAKDYKDAQGFYSVLEKTIDEKVGGKVDSASLAKMLDKNGVKQDEIEWSGLKELMESKEKLTKEEIEETLKSNRLVVEVVERDSQLDKETINSLKMFENSKFVEIEGKIPKYSEYKLKGGENYRELLFRKPAKLDAEIKFIKSDDGYWYAEKAPYDGTNVVTSSKSKAGLEKEFNVKEFKSNHWDEGNIIVFTRVDDRTIDGKKALFVQELQSDWHQEGRKLGYTPSALEINSAKKRLEQLLKDSNDLSKEFGRKEAQEMNNLEVMLNGRANIPNAPFKKNWHELGLKRMVQEAVANDYDKIAWTTGKQQADRYSLEKTVDTVVYNKDAGVIQATNGSKEVFFKRVANEKEIEDIMGKELTARLLDKKNTTTNSVHVLQGEELKFGGEGMQAFYDEIVPNSAKKLFKKYGVKPKMEELDDVEQMVWSVDITPAMKEDVKKYGQPLYAVGGAVIANEATKGEEQ